MNLVLRLKGGPGSGWHAPPKGTHVGGDIKVVGDSVSLPRGHRVGMGSLKKVTPATVIGVERREDDSVFYRVKYVDKRGDDRTTYVDDSDLLEEQ